MEKYKRVAIIGASVILILAAIYLFVKYALGIILPFLFAFLIAFISRPLVDRVCRKTRLNRSVVSVVIMFLLLFFIVYLLFIVLSASLTQLGNIIASLTEQLSGEENFVKDVVVFIDSLKIKFPFLLDGIMGGEESVYTVALDMITEGLKNMGMRITSYLASVLASLPSILITAGVIILSLFYFSKDYDSITEYIKSIVPNGMKRKISNVKDDVLTVTAKYFKSYGILLILTFFELFIGFLILKIENAFIIAVIVSFVDILPVLGVGCVLLPWAIIVFIGGNTPLAMGLLILYVAVYFLRQVEEPKIIGKQMNVHPLFALFTMYAGLKIAGVFGMIIGPFIAFIIKTVYDSFKNKKDIENEKNL